jgi:hypothetical protein
MTTSPTPATVVADAPVPPALVVERVLRRGRLSVAFRLLLALPQVIVLEVLGLAAAVVVFIGWFAALILGRLPEPFARYLCHFTRYAARVYAYIGLLTDRYPPFRLTAPDYPVQLDLWPGRLNRFAVLFRLILAIPASILAGLVFAGWEVLAFFIWLIVLVIGRVPGALFDAITAVIRYYLRLIAYGNLITAAYPWGLFGDQPPPAGFPAPAGFPTMAAAPGEALAAPVDQYAAPAEAFTTPVEAFTTPAETAPAEGPPATPTPSGAGAGPEPPAPRAPRGLLVLSGGAKALLAVFIVLGLATNAAASAVQVVNGGTVSRVEALAKVTAAHDTLVDRTQQFQQKVKGCTTTGNRLSCVQAADRDLADAFEAFAVRVDGVDFPKSAQTEAAEVVRLGHRFAGAMRELVAAPSVEEYTRLASGTDQIGASFDQGYQALIDKLTSP